MVATDCGRTTFFLPTKTAGIYRFCGTSASAPHAAAVVALARQANPSLTPAQIQAGLAATARPVGAFGPDAVGAGLVDADRLLEDFALPPAIAIVNPPAALSNNRSPSIGFSANRPVSFACSLDGGEPLPCTSPFTPLDPLADGLHGFAVRGEDLAGKVGISPTVTFTVDTIPPRTSFSAKPRRVLRTRSRRAKAVFGFVSSEPDSRFTCRIDGGLAHFCPPRLARRYKVGRHVLRATAVDAAGNVDRTPATFRFEVKRVGRRLTSAERRDWRRTIQWPPRSRASSAAALPRTSGSVRLRPLEPGAEVDRERGDRQVADRGRPGEAPERHAGGAGRVTDEAEGDDRDQPHADQQGGAAALDHRLDALEALRAEPAVEQRPRHRAPDRVTEQAGEHPADHDQRQGREEAVDEAGRGVDDLGRVEDDGVDQREGEDQQRPGDAEAVELACGLRRCRRGSRRRTRGAAPGSRAPGRRAARSPPG